MNISPKISVCKFIDKEMWPSSDDRRLYRSAQTTLQ